MFLHFYPQKIYVDIFFAPGWFLFLIFEPALIDFKSGLLNFTQSIRFYVSKWTFYMKIITKEKKIILFIYQITTPIKSTEYTELLKQ